MFQCQIDGHNYKIEKLNAFDQLHLARKVAPLLPKLLPALPAALSVGIDIKKAVDDKQDLPVKTIESISWIIEPALDAISSMQKDDVEYIIGLCLSVTKRQNGDIWTAAWHNGQLMLGDMNMMTMVKIVWQVIQVNLGNYFPTGRSTPPASAANQ